MDQHQRPHAADLCPPAPVAATTSPRRTRRRQEPGRAGPPGCAGLTAARCGRRTRARHQPGRQARHPGRRASPRRHPIGPGAPLECAVTQSQRRNRTKVPFWCSPTWHRLPTAGQRDSWSVAMAKKAPTQGPCLPLSREAGNSFMTYQPDIAAVAPTLELTLDYAEVSLRCAGTLDTRTRGHVVDAVDELLAGEPASIVIDVADLYVADIDGANTLATVQRMVRDAGIRLRWQGLDSDHLRGILPLRYRARRSRPEASLRTGRPLGRATHPSMVPPA
jgi:anti-anti-sigma regulatory factor